MNNQSRDLLNADELLAEPLTPARWTKRLANLLIDTFFFYLFILVIGFVAAMINPAVIDWLDETHPLVDRLIGSLLFVAYYVIFENWLGKTPGKMITKTKVVDVKGEKPTFTTLLGRNFSRLIPFDALTFFRETPIGMHDRIAHTLVVDDRPRFSFDRSLATDED